VPVEFIAVRRPAHAAGHHELLLANALAQAQALMQGKADAGGHRNFASGNRPSTFFLLEGETPASAWVRCWRCTSTACSPAARCGASTASTSGAWSWARCWRQDIGRDAVLAKAEASGSILRHRYRIEPDQLGLVRFSWNVPNAGAGANLTLPQLDDVPVRVVLAFEGDRSRLSMKNSLLSELSRLLTGEEMPFATLVYSWSRVNQPGEVVVNERTDRIRKIVVDSGDHGYNEWRSYERDIRADYRKAFGEDPGALLSFAVFTEGEKNEGQLQAFYGPLKLVPASAVARK
jgi:hypothetical protein